MSCAEVSNKFSSSVLVANLNQPNGIVPQASICRNMGCCNFMKLISDINERMEQKSNALNVESASQFEAKVSNNVIKPEAISNQTYKQVSPFFYFKQV